MSRTQRADRGIRTLREQWEEDGNRVDDEVSGDSGSKARDPGKGSRPPAEGAPPA